jgi:hypothetical protein
MSGGTELEQKMNINKIISKVAKEVVILEKGKIEKNDINIMYNYNYT